MKVYTRTGDDGSTALGNGRRVSKASLRVAAYGDVDELNSVLGLLVAEVPPSRVAEELARMQWTLFEVGALLANPSGGRGATTETLAPVWLESWIDAMSQELPPLRSFIVPGGSRGASLAHLARAICRRAERRVVELRESGEDVGEVLPFLNRTSDALFVCARWLNQSDGVADVPWRARG